MKKNLVVWVLVINYVLASVTTVSLMYTGTSSSLFNDLYGVLFLGFIPLLGGLNGVLIARHWGFLGSAVGRATLFLSFGLIFWAVGTYTFSGYYNFFSQVDVPYPSLADVGYILSLPLWAYGMVQLSRATGARYSMRSLKGKALLLLVPLLIIVSSYYLLVVVARGGASFFSDSESLKLVFDLAYPIGDVVILTLVTLIFGLSYKYFGGVYKNAIKVILAGFVLMYVADFSFSYTTTLDTFVTGYWVDWLFTTAVFALSLGVAMFDAKQLTDK